MSTSGPHDLGSASGTATSNQGVPQTAIDEQDGAAIAPGAKSLVTITPPELAGSIYEPPNKSSTMGLEQPQRAKASFPSPNHLRLVVVIGLMVLILVAVITASPYTNELLVLLGIIVGFYFGKEYARS